MNFLDPSSREPLFPLILASISEEATAHPSIWIGGDVDQYPKSDDVNAARLAKFWLEAHFLSCLKHRSFQSSAEVTYNATMATSLDGLFSFHGEFINTSGYNRMLHLDLVRNIIGDNDACAYIAENGTITNDNDDGFEDNNKCFRAAYCARSRNTSLSFASDCQIETIARLSGFLLSQALKCDRYTAEAEKVAPKAQQASDVSLIDENVINKEVNYAIEKALTADDGKDDYSGLFESSNQSADAEFDNAGTTRAECVEGRALGNTDEIISITLVASTCRQLLEFAHQRAALLGGGDQRTQLFCLRDGDHGDVLERVVLRRHGFDACSLGSLCLQAGNRMAMNPTSNKSSGNSSSAAANNDGMKMMGLCNILSHLSEREVDLMAHTLCESNHALIEGQGRIITLFPGGIPVDYQPQRSDHTLFQIHVTKIAIQNRMMRLEQDASAARSYAVSARRNDMAQSALAQVRKRKAVLVDLERCSTLLVNLYASELRLEQAKSDAQVVESCAILRTVLQGLCRSKNSIGDEEDVEDMMDDIREEMEAADETSKLLGETPYYPEVEDDFIGEKEVMEEFMQLELECDEEEEAHAVALKRNEGMESQSDYFPTVTQAPGEQSGEGYETPKSKVMAA